MRDTLAMTTPDATMTAPAPGDLGAVLAKLGFVAAVSVARADGAPLTDFDREAIADVIAAAAERDAMTGGALADLVFLRRTARGDKRELAEKTAAPRAARPKAKGKRAAAKRPAR